MVSLACEHILPRPGHADSGYNRIPHAVHARATGLTPIIEASLQRLKAAQPVDPNNHIGAIPIAWDGVTKATDVIAVIKGIQAQTAKLEEQPANG